MPALLFAKSVVEKLALAGHTAYFAGGCVRDQLMGHPSDDIDIATSASVAQIQALFPKTIPVGIAFGIVIVVENGHHFEVATFRKECGYTDGRRPTAIEPATPEEDAQRRDFTINGMFFDPITETLYDYVNGQADIARKVIRAIGDPHERFLEDRLRMMRAVRYSTRFDFSIEVETMASIRSHAKSLLPAVAMERVWQEFKKMSQFAHFDRGLLLLHELELLPTIFPALKEIPLEVIKQRLAPLSLFPKGAPTIVDVLELFPEHSLEQLFELCDYLKLSRGERDIVAFLHHAKSLLQMPLSWQQDLEKAEWARFYANPHSPICLAIYAARLPLEEKESFTKRHKERSAQLEKAISRIREQKPLITASILMAEGINPGVQMGKLLKEAERYSINTSSEDPKEIIHFLKNSPLWNT